MSLTIYLDGTPKQDLTKFTNNKKLYLRFEKLTLYHVSACLWATKYPSIHSTEELPLSEWRLKSSPLRPIWWETRNQVILWRLGERIQNLCLKTNLVRPLLPWQVSSPLVKTTQWNWTKNPSIPCLKMWTNVLNISQTAGKTIKVKLKMAMHIVHKKSGVGVCVWERERERTNRETNSNT